MDIADKIDNVLNEVSKTKQDFEIRIIAKGAKKEFKKGMGKGVILSQVVTLTLPDEIDKSIKERIAVQLNRMGRELIDDSFEIKFHTVDKKKKNKQ